ncbi:hypothetical protein GCM10027605_38170 [Micromonospora zhanjiangensis]
MLVRTAIVGAAVACATALAAPAWADVAITPNFAVRGDAAKVTFRVSDTRPGAYTTKVELRFPADVPVAEVYPLSVPDWAPQMTTRTLDNPIGGLHQGATSTVTSAVIWTRAGAGRPGGAADLTISMGPIPQRDRLTFTLLQTYSDGTVATFGDPVAGAPEPAGPAPVLTLLVGPDPVHGDGEQHAGGHSGTGTADDAAAAPVDEAAASTDDGSGLSGGELLAMGLAGGVAAGLALGAVAISVTRRRALATAGPQPSAATADTLAPTDGTPAAATRHATDGKSAAAEHSTADANSVSGEKSGADLQSGVDEGSAVPRDKAAIDGTPSAPRRAWRLREPATRP